ncbi:RNA polymerase sigma factor [Steroidobacter flavus]|uniref:RNA polymerase sigma factor n=1 Tax=Steroidobacter flavus TaxID=1842136 RepID=A0ABV8SLX3_9GAMM
MISSRDLAQAAAKEYSGNLRDYLSRRVSNPQDVEDLAQSTFEKILSINNRMPFIRKPLGFLLTLASWTLAEFRANRAKEREHMVWLYELEQSAEGDDGASIQQWSSEDPEDRQHYAELLKKVETKLADMPTAYAAIVLLVRDGLSYAEAAERLEMTEAALKKCIQRARAKLRIRLSREARR